MLAGAGAPAVLADAPASVMLADVGATAVLALFSSAGYQGRPPAAHAVFPPLSDVARGEDLRWNELVQLRRLARARTVGARSSCA